jgi:hypothetical protein
VVQLPVRHVDEARRLCLKTWRRLHAARRRHTGRVESGGGGTKFASSSPAWHCSDTCAPSPERCECECVCSLRCLALGAPHPPDPNYLEPPPCAAPCWSRSASLPSTRISSGVATCSWLSPRASPRGFRNGYRPCGLGFVVPDGLQPAAAQVVALGHAPHPGVQLHHQRPHRPGACAVATPNC